MGLAAMPGSKLAIAASTSGLLKQSEQMPLCRVVEHKYAQVMTWRKGRL